MRSPAMIIIEVAREKAFEMAFVQHDDMVQTVAPDAAYQPFRERILPRTAWCGDDLFDPETIDAAPKLCAVDAIAITEQIARGLIPGERLDDLLRGPLFGGMLGDVKVHYPAPIMGKDHEHKEHPEIQSRHHEKVDGYQLVDMVVQKRLPSRRGWFTRSHPVFLDGGLCYIDTELAQLAHDARRTPQRISLEEFAANRAGPP